jgi:predicted amidophosphoribosyltransferase
MGQVRPRTKYVRLLKRKRCPKCGKPINRKKVRCRRCHAIQPKLRPWR